MGDARSGSGGRAPMPSVAGGTRGASVCLGGNGVGGSPMGGGRAWGLGGGAWGLGFRGCALMGGVFNASLALHLCVCVRARVCGCVWMCVNVCVCVNVWM